MHLDFVVAYHNLSSRSGDHVRLVHLCCRSIVLAVALLSGLVLLFGMCLFHLAERLLVDHDHGRRPSHLCQSHGSCLLLGCCRPRKRRTRPRPPAPRRGKTCLRRRFVDLENVSHQTAKVRQRRCSPLKFLPYCLPDRSRPSLPSCVQSAIRPNLSLFE